MKKGKNDNDNGCRYGGTPAPNVWGVFLFSFSFPHLIVSWFVYACQPVGVSCFYAVSMYAMSPDSGVYFCWCCCFCVMIMLIYCWHCLQCGERFGVHGGGSGYGCRVHGWEWGFGVFGLWFDLVS